MLELQGALSDKNIVRRFIKIIERSTAVAGMNILLVMTLGVNVPPSATIIITMDDRPSIQRPHDVSNPQVHLWWS